jgi:hypothetical protein
MRRHHRRGTVNLRLFFYDETCAVESKLPGADCWKPLPSTVDVQNKLLTAYSDHLTIFDYKADDWEAARLPSLEAFQVSTFTGAATYALPLWVPPGPAGLQPEVSLSYHSAASDQATAETQAAWVGMGLRLQRAGRTDPPGRRQGPAHLPVLRQPGAAAGQALPHGRQLPSQPNLPRQLHLRPGYERQGAADEHG